MRRSLVVALLLLGSLAKAQTAPTMTGPAGTYAVASSVTVKSTGPLTIGPNAPTMSGPAGVYSITCPDVVTIERGDGYIVVRWGNAPTPPVPPGPTPGPTPGPRPGPTPAPIPVQGLRVLMIYESNDLSRMPPAQMSILYDAGLRAYLDSVTPVGPDGKTHEYRVWDKDVNAEGAAQLWQNALARKRTSVPWIVVSNGTTGYEGPLPATTAQTMALIKQYEVKP